MRVDLGFKPRQWQRECFAQMHRSRFTVLALHRRAGKTELALRWLLDKALRNDKELPFFLYVAPFLRQSKLIAWSRLKAIVRPLVDVGLADINEGELFVRLTTNGAMIRCAGADNEHALRGVRLDGVVIDEVAQIAPPVWEEVLQPALSDRKGWALFIGTPSGLNLFSQLFFAAPNKPDWFAARYTANDTEALDPEELARLRADMSEATYAREMLCDFTAAGEDQLISLTDLELASERHLQRTDYDWAARILTVDPARFGSDRSTIGRRQGRMLLPFKPGLHVLHGVDNMTLAARVADEIKAWQPHAVFIDEGNGGGVIDRLRQMGHNIIGVHFGGKAGSLRYANKRTEMWFGIREWLASGGVIPNDQALKRDLAAPTYKFTATSDVYQLESKDDIKKRLGMSPDLGDAVALTFAFPVHRDLKNEALQLAGVDISTGIDDVLNYNPLDNI